MGSTKSNGFSDVRLLLLAMGLNSLPLGYTLVVIPIFLSNIGFSGEAIGAITAASSMANTIALIPFAIAADRYGRKPFVICGFLTATLAYALFAFTRELNILILAGAIGGIGLAGGVSTAIWTPAWTALISDKVTAEKRSSVFAWSQVSYTLALTLGSAASILPELFRRQAGSTFSQSYSYPFLIFGGLSILAGLVPLTVSENDHARPGKKKTNWAGFLPRKSSSQIVKFSVTLGLVGFSAGLGFQLLSLWFKRVYATSETVLGPWFAVAEITSFVVIPVIPRLTKSFGSPLSVLISQGLSAGLLASMVFAPTYQLAAVIFVGRSFLMNISWPIQQSYLMGTVTPEERASASAITYTVWGIGNSISPIIAGYLLSQTDPIILSTPLLFGSLGYLSAAVAFYFLFRRTPPPEEVFPLSNIPH